MAWRLAGSLVQLRSEVNAKWPTRSKISDGTIGDSAHASSASDHNPNTEDVVCALDLTHDPANGFDAHALADYLVANRHPNLKYVISDSRIAGPWIGWNWGYYDGMNSHDKHIHISVGVGEDGESVQPYDDKTKWLKEEVEMVTLQGLQVIYRLRLGRAPTQHALDNFLGKVTFDQADNAVINSTAYKQEIEKFKSGQGDAVAHLPGAIQAVIKK